MGFFLTKTTLLYGIRQYDQIITFFEKIPEFKNLISQNTLDKFVKEQTPDAFKNVISEILTCEKQKLTDNLNSFKNNFKNGKYSSFIEKNTFDVIGLIIENYPNDVGIFLPFVLNVVISSPGKSLIFPTGTLHTYLDGDLIEIMALSDNVVRAAMTPKYVDVETLLHIMEFDPIIPQFIEPKKEIEINANTFLNYYPTGYESFNLEHGRIEPHKSIKIHSKKYSSILAVLKGNIKLNGEKYSVGDSILILGNTEIQLENYGNDIADIFIGSSQ